MYRKLLGVVAMLCALAASAQQQQPPKTALKTPATNVIVDPGTAILAKGLIHSSLSGFKFPDDTVQTSAAKVNGIATPVTIAGSGAAQVSTSGSTITLDVKPTYVRTIVVSPVPGNDEASGTALLNALASITGHSSSNRYLIKIEPGVFFLGENQLVMKPYVDIEGSGMAGTTILTMRGSTSHVAAAAGVVGANSAELRQLKLRNVASDDHGICYWGPGVITSIANVAMVSEGSETATGIFLDMTNATISEVVIHASNGTGTTGFGIIVASAPVQVRNSFIRVLAGATAAGSSIGIMVSGSSSRVDIDSSRIEAWNYPGGTAVGARVNAGALGLTNCDVSAINGSYRRALWTTTSAGSMEVHQSRLNTSGTSIDSDDAAIERADGSSIRVFGSMVHGRSIGSPVCILSYSLYGANDDGTGVCKSTL